jgi:HK97 family phage major capsid protein
VGGWCNYSKQLLAQSSLDIEGIVRDDLIQIIQIAIDNVALNGTGVNQPTGIFNMAANPGPPTPPYNYAQAAPSIGFGSGYPTWAQVLAFETNVETGNLVLDDTAAYITSIGVKGAWKGYAKSDPRNTSIWFPAFFWESDNTVNGFKAIATNQITGNRVVFGKWNELMIGQWAGLDLVVDIYSLATQAEVRVIANMFVDVKYRYTSAFAYSTNSGISN